MKARQLIDRNLAVRVRGAIARQDYSRAIVMAVELGHMNDDLSVWNAYCGLQNENASQESISAAIERLIELVGTVKS